MTDGTMFALDIGMDNVEEINIVRNGGNYGWMKREGYWENGMSRPGGALNQLFPLPADVLDGRTKDEFIYPVAIYDHDEGVAISGGFAYNGKIPALRGKFVFGDVNRGRVFVADTAAMKKADDGIPQTVAPIEEIQLYTRDAERRPGRRHVQGTGRENDGHDAHARRSAHQPQPRRRAVPDVAPGRLDPDAGAVAGDPGVPSRARCSTDAFFTVRWPTVEYERNARLDCFADIQRVGSVNVRVEVDRPRGLN